MTRGIAIVPVVIVTAFYGERGTGQLLVFSQVVLSMQLPFAVIPLVRFVSDRRKMGKFAISRTVARRGVDRGRHHRGAEREAAVRYVLRVRQFRSPDGAKRNPGFSNSRLPDFASLHPGYGLALILRLGRHFA